MSRIRLYLDEDAMRRSLVFGLRARNVDVATALDTEMINRNDEDHLLKAASSGRALYTYNAADYCLLHHKWVTKDRAHAGIIISAQQRYFATEKLRRLMRLVSSISAEQMRNQLEFLSSWS
jgi:Domain of unknown function (DUF5615)